MEYVTHPLIKPEKIEKRSYQVSLAEIAMKRSSMIVLPTGLGKTIIATLVIADRLSKGKALILAPTKPLVEQHAEFLKNVLTLKAEEIEVFTGELAPSERSVLWENGRIIVSTPQVIENDLLSKRIVLKDVAHITFDECHRAVGNYAYVYIAERYAEEKDSLVLGITASPGSDIDKITQICSNLHIEDVEVRTEYDDDVSPYVYKKDIEWRRVDLPEEMGELGRLMEDVLSTRLNELHTLGILPKRDVSSKELLDAQRRVQNLLLEKKHPELYRALSLIAEVFKIKHGINLIETQGIFALKRYFDRLKNEAESKKGSKASKRLISEPKIRTLLQRLEEQRVEHPKLMVMSDILIDQIRKNPYSKTIVFTNYRDTTEMISAYLSDIEGINAIKFIGQASKYMDKGLTQKQQVDIIDKFKDGEYNVLVATSVAEEGLDIPSTDLVLFYEPVPSEIRSIQRKGRTGRRRVGKIIVLITNKTKDEGYYWISKMKEEKMYREMKVLQASLGKIPMEMRRTSLKDLSADSPLVNHISADSAKPNQILLRKIGQHGVKIFVDQREMRSSVVKDLERLGADLVIRTMEVGDYVVSERVCIERKRVEDLSGSMTNKYIFDQLSDLKRTYERPLLIIEGDVYHSNVHPNAIRGLLASIAIDFGIPIIQTRDEEDTASFILTIAKREKEERREFNPHGSKRNSTLREEQEYVVSSISNIGPAIARNLLRHFKSVEEVVTAPKEELMRVERVGSVTANRIRDVISSKYE